MALSQASWQPQPLASQLRPAFHSLNLGYKAKEYHGSATSQVCYAMMHGQQLLKLKQHQDQEEGLFKCRFLEPLQRHVSV